MKNFITGICGFVGSEMVPGLRAAGYAMSGCDNFRRAGRELNGLRPGGNGWSRRGESGENTTVL